VTLLLAFPVLAAEASSPTNLVGVLQSETSFNDYTLRIYRDDDSFEGSFEILRRGKRVHVQQGYKFQLSSFDDFDEKQPLFQIGRDIAGNGIPNLVVLEWTGGAHCCYNFNVFEIGEEFRKITTLEAEHSLDAGFLDLDGDGRLEFKMQDWTFAYWNASFVESPAPGLILRYQQGEYRLAGDLMLRPPPTKKKLAAMAKTVKAAFNTQATPSYDWQIPPELWGEMLDLIYSGNMDSAWRLVDLVWPPKQPGKESFLVDFREQLSTSPYYTQVLALNGQSQVSPATNEISTSLTSTALHPEATGSVVSNVSAAVVDGQSPSNVSPIGLGQPRLHLCLDPTPGLFLFGVPGRSYRIEYADDLQS
jgi:hypothetical protein